jgi:hypothetical protein
MKFLSWLGVCAMAAMPVVGFAADAPVKLDLDKPAAPTTYAPKPDEKKKEPEKKKDETIGKIDGIEIKRGSGFMGVAVVGGNFKITFYDAKKKPVPVPPEIARAVLRWQVKYQPQDERVVLNPTEDNKALTSPKVIKAPLVFKLFITMIASGGGDESASESYPIDFRG